MTRYNHINALEAPYLNFEPYPYNTPTNTLKSKIRGARGIRGAHTDTPHAQAQPLASPKMSTFCGVISKFCTLKNREK